MADGTGQRTEQSSREQGRRQRLEVSFCRRLGLMGRGGMPFEVDCGVGPNGVQNHANTNRTSPLTAELGSVCQMAVEAVESVESFVPAADCSELLRPSTQIYPVPKLLACPASQPQPVPPGVQCLACAARPLRAGPQISSGALALPWTSASPKFEMGAAVQQ